MAADPSGTQICRVSTSAELLLGRVRAACEDEYTIDRELGRGGMAAVFLARDIALQRRVAIKVMLPDLIDVEGIADRFVIEARTSAHLDHPGIVTVYSVKQRAGLLFIVMKYIEGRTLESVLTGAQGLETPVITEIVSHVAEALHFAHTEGVIHRDVKPSNIIIDTKGRPVVSMMMFDGFDDRHARVHESRAMPWIACNGGVGPVRARRDAVRNARAPSAI